MSQAELQGAVGAALGANYPDAIRIKRIEGTLYFRPTQQIIAGDPGDVQICFATAVSNSYTTYLRMGLRKAQGPQSQAGIPDALNPLNNGATPFELSDYADGRWMKMWEHVWDPMGEITGVSGNQFSCCTEQASYAVPATASGTQAGYTVPAAVCVPCGDVESPAVNLSCEFTNMLPRWWRCPIRYGRTIVLKENDDLALYYGWEKLMEFNDVARREQPSMELFGGVRMLLES